MDSIPRRVVIASDHAGVEMKRQLREAMLALGISAEDLGTGSVDSVDYPDYAAAVAGRVSTGAADVGVLICGTGIGMSITANRFPGVRAAILYDDDAARSFPHAQRRQRRRLRRAHDVRGRRGAAAATLPVGNVRGGKAHPAARQDPRHREDHSGRHRAGRTTRGAHVLPERDRPRDLRHHSQGDGAAGVQARADRLRELRERGGPRGHRVRADEQVRRGIPREAVLRRVRVRGPGRVAGDRAGEEDLRSRARQRAAPRRLPGEHGRLLLGDEPGRHDAGDEPLPTAAT